MNIHFTGQIGNSVLLSADGNLADGQFLDKMLLVATQNNCP